MTPVKAAGVLLAFAEAGVLAEADVHVALRLGRLGDEARETVLLAAALAVRGVRTGSVCVDLATVAEQVVLEPLPGDAASGEATSGAADVLLPWPADWAALEASPVVAVGTDATWKPLRLVDGLLYLDRYWQQEQLLRRELAARAAAVQPVVDLTPIAALFDVDSDRQRLAASVAASRWVSVITGGPGTGKTHTVARLLKLLLEQDGPPVRIALAAPTGKAAARLQESVQEQAAAIGLPTDLTASTLHRLLGWKPGNRSRFKHDASNHLPYDVVVVDESSMVSLTLMARLLEALRPTCRLVLVGDPDQLTPVDAGAVLSDLVHLPAPPDEADGAFDLAGLDDEERRQLRNNVVRLRDSHRFGPSIGGLAEAIRTGDADLVVRLLADGDGLSLVADTEGLRAEMVAVAAQLSSAARDGDAEEALRLLTAHRLLCAHRHGPFGVSTWNEQVDRWTGATPGQWQPGTPLLVTANDYENRLWNGDTGVVVSTPGGRRAAFARSTGVETFALSRLSSAQVVHAMTVHRAQGSQYDTVSVLLPDEGSAVLTRELLYTAVTRAVSRVRVIGSEEVVRAAVARQVVRASGLRRP